MNDLVGMEYEWGSQPSQGKTDCWQLVIEVRKRLGLQTPSFSWVYDECGEGVQVELLESLVTTYGVRCSVEDGAIAVIPSKSHGVAFGCCFGGNICFTGMGSRVVVKPVQRIGRCVSFYRLKDT